MRASRHTADTVLTRHEHIAAILRKELAAGRYIASRRFPSQNELAKRFHTSPITAREAVGLLVQEGLLDISTSLPAQTRGSPEFWLWDR